MVWFCFVFPHLLSFTEVFKLCYGIVSPGRSLKEWQASSSGRMGLSLGNNAQMRFPNIWLKYCASCLFYSSSPFTFCLIRKYIAIVSYEQRQNYKDDFNAEYDEYRALHARMETVARRFIKLDAQRKRLSPGSKEYQVNTCFPQWTDFIFCLLPFSALPIPRRPASLQSRSFHRPASLQLLALT